MKMIVRRYLLLHSLLFLSSIIHAQTNEADSLIAVLETLKDDTVKVKALNDLSSIYWDIEPDVAIMYGVQAMELANKIYYQKGVAYALKNIGMGYYTKADYINVLENWNKSLAIFDSIGDMVGVSNILNNIGSVYFNQGDEATAVDYFFDGLRVAEEISSKVRIASAYLNIGNVYSINTETYERSIDYYSQALKLGLELDDQDMVGTASVNMGELYMRMANFDSALVYFEQSLEAFRSIESSGVPYSLNNIGRLYSNIEEYASAIKYHQEAFEISKTIMDDIELARSLVGIGNAYRLSKNLYEAIPPYLEAESIAKEVGAQKELQELYQGLSAVYSELKNYPKALNYQTLLTEINYEMYNAENDKKIERMQFTYEIDKQKDQISLLTTETALQEAEMKRQKIANRAFLVGLVLVVIIVAILLYSYREKVKTFKILDRQKVQIENLILNILPKEIARELQNDGHATPRYYKQASILFTDFKGFTTISQGLSPNELVDHLNDFFHAFDDIMGQFNIEKIKTIGDAYMCAAGIPMPNKTHPIDIVKAGLAIQEYINEKNKELEAKGEPPWNLRVGIHTGPVVAGVVGKKKYAYDVWGSTVNIASRMESNGEIGKVNISDATYKLIKDQYKCHHRGKISAKNIGEIDMYFIEEEIPVIQETVSVIA